MTTKQAIRYYFTNHRLVMGNARFIQIELEERYSKNVSLATIRRALKQLMAEGFLTKSIGRRLSGRVDHVQWGRADRRDYR